MADSKHRVYVYGLSDCVYMYICIYVHVYICMFSACICTYVYMCIHMYVSEYTVHKSDKPDKFVLQ